MKKTDIAMIILIASISVFAAFFITKSILGDPGEQKKTVKTIEAVESTIVSPDAAIFNGGAINPTVEVQINPVAQ